jgi:hypothetical protein
MTWVTSLLSFFTNPIADLSGGYRERQRIAAESAADIAEAHTQLKLAKVNAKTRRLDNQDSNAISYDMTVLNNRADTYMDGLIIVVFLGLFICHFIPVMQPYMSNGWAAMGYNGAPWYFEFIIVGIAVSTLGLMSLFRAFWRKNDNQGGK